MKLVLASLIALSFAAVSAHADPVERCHGKKETGSYTLTFKKHSKSGLGDEVREAIEKKGSGLEIVADFKSLIVVKAKNADGRELLGEFESQGVKVECETKVDREPKDDAE